MTTPSPGGRCDPSEVVRPVHGQWIGLHEGSTVHQQLDALAGGQLAAVVLLLRRIPASGREGLPALAELVDPFLDGASSRSRRPCPWWPWAESMLPTCARRLPPQRGERRDRTHGRPLSTPSVASRLRATSVVDDHPDRHDRARPAVESGPRQAPRRAARTVVPPGPQVAVVLVEPAVPAVGDEVADGSRPLSRRAMQVGSRTASGTGPNRSTAQEMRREKAWSDWPSEAMEVARTGEVVGGGRRRSEEDPREEQEDGGVGAGSRQRIISVVKRAEPPMGRSRSAALARPYPSREPVSHSSHVHTTANPPVGACLAVEARRPRDTCGGGVVVEERPDGRVHLALVVPDPGSNSRRSVRGRCVASTPSSVPRSGARRRRSTEHRLLVLGCRAERRPRVARRPDLLGRPSQGLDAESERAAVGLQASGPAFASRVRCRHARQGRSSASARAWPWPRPRPGRRRWSRSGSARLEGCRSGARSCRSRCLP